MANAFHYRPKYVDIRVNKPMEESKRRANERACDHVGCERAGEHPAPKSRDQAGQFWYFCREHASEYNRRWNYFDGMSEAEFVSFQQGEEIGHRPTWTFKPGRGERVNRTRFFQAAAPGDAFRLFGRTGEAKAQAAPRLSRLQVKALETLSLEESADRTAIRTRYAELVKRLHPDSNGGDRSSEGMLQKVVQAFQVLKQAGLA